MARRPHLCFVGWGHHVHTERWVNRFADAGFELSVISFSRAGNYAPGVRQFNLMALPFNSHRLRMAALRLLFAYLRPDIVHVHYAGFLVNVAPNWHGRMVVTVWGSDIYRTHVIEDEQRRLIAEYLPRARLVTCDSEDLKVAIGEFCPRVAPVTEVVQWGVDTALFTPSATASRIADRLELAGRTVFLSPRNFYPLYRLVEIVQAFAQVAQRLPDAVLLMKRYAAEADYSQRVEALIDKFGIRSRVHILEQVDYAEMPDFYRSGAVMISVPESDGTPMSLLEAMACGCLPIVSDLPSLHEWVVDGDNGRVVPVGDVDALAAAMLDMANCSERERIIAHNLALVRERASQQASRDYMVARYQALCAP